MEITGPSDRAGGEGSSRATTFDRAGGEDSERATTNGSKKAVIIDGDNDTEADEADGDEETFAVEKILNHRIRSKGAVPPHPFSS